jgi:ATP-dependent Zn protease
MNTAAHPDDSPEHFNLVKATHEAGHAIASLEVELPVYVATIIPDRSSPDPAHWSLAHVSSKMMNTRHRAFDEMTMLVAGKIAQEKACPGCWLLQNGERSDYEKTRYRVARYYRNDGDFIVHAEKQAAEITNRRWADVEKLAHALVERQTLTGEQITMLLARPYRIRASYIQRDITYG